MPQGPYRQTNAHAAQLSPFERHEVATVCTSPFVEYCMNIPGARSRFGRPEVRALAVKTARGSSATMRVQAAASPGIAAPIHRGENECKTLKRFRGALVHEVIRIIQQG
jgi:hypothetical protein